MTESKSVALPLGYTPMLIYLMGRLMGIEPTNAGTTIRCVSHFATIAKMVEGDGFEPPNPKERIYSPPRLATSLPLQGIWCRR